MPLLTAVLALSLSALQGEARTVTLGTYSFDGRTVSATVPSAPGPIGADQKSAEKDGEKYLVDSEGRLLRRFRFEGGWSEVRGGFAAAKAAMTPATPEWRVKVFVLPRSEILDVAKSGLARVRRSTMESIEITHVSDSVARFAAMAEAAAGGKLRVKIEYEVDHDAAPQTAAPGKRPFGQAFLDEYLRPRINGGTYDAEDKVNRGPFDSVFVVHAGLCGPMPMATVAGTPVTPVAFYAEGFPVGPYALSIALYNGWVNHLALAAAKAGYRNPEKAISKVPATPAEAEQGYRGLLDFYPLPLVPRRDETPTEEFVANRALPELQSVIYDPSNPPSATASVRTLSQDEVAAGLEPDGNTAAKIAVQGGMTVVDKQDPDRGAVLEFRLRGLVRSGRALLLGRPDGPAIFSVGTHPFLSFFIKASNAEPMNLRVVPGNGGPDRVVRLFGAWPEPAEVDDGMSASAIPLAGTGWNSVVVDLRKFGPATVSAIYLESNEWAGYWEPKQAVSPSVLFDDLKATKTSAASESPSIAVENSQAEARALQAVNAMADDPSLLALLKDPDDMVRLNAARAYSRIKSAAAEAPLIDNTRSLDTRVCEAAIEALAFQDTPGGWAAMKRAIEIGPFDFTRGFAARALGQKKDSKNVGTLSLMLTARSWRGRMYGAESIGANASEPQQMVLMAFLHEIDPAVRLAVTKVAGTAYEEVNKRLLWSAVNDPSDEIRAWSCLKLVRATNPKYVVEGLKGVRDDSVGMRIRLLQLMAESPLEAFRPALRQAVTDASPSVRAAALRAFAALPGAVAKEELAGTPDDTDPRVQSAMAEFRKAKPPA